MRIFIRMLLICWAVTFPCGAFLFLAPSGTSSSLRDRERTLPIAILQNCALRAAQYSEASQLALEKGECPPAHLIATGIQARSDLNGQSLSIEQTRLAHRVEQESGISILYLPNATLVAFKALPALTRSPIYLVSIPLTRERVLLTVLNHVGRITFATGLLSLIIASFFVRPVTRLSGVAQKFGEGDLKVRVSPSLERRKDELGDLGRTFNNMASQIETLVNEYRVFLAHASHELGSPLTRLNMALALAKRKAGGDLQMEHERIGQEADRLNNLVQEMLLLARLESGNELSKNTTMFDAAQVAKEAHENASFESQESVKMVSLTNVEGFLVRGYPELFARAVDNVLRNGLRFAHHQVVMQMSATVGSPTPLGVIVIEDDGPGVPEGREGEIFRPFFTLAEESTNDVLGGSGLGLAIAQQAVLANGGRIFATRSNLGGLKIVIEMPITGGREL